MKDASRNNIRLVLSPKMYGHMLVIRDNEILCPSCTEYRVKTLIKDLRSGYATQYGVLNLIDLDDGAYCDDCGNFCFDYE
jgi:hypothetical protein